MLVGALMHTLFCGLKESLICCFLFSIDFFVGTSSQLAALLAAVLTAFHQFGREFDFDFGFVDSRVVLQRTRWLCRTGW